MKIYKIIIALGLLSLVGCAENPATSSPEVSRKWFSYDGFNYSSLLSLADVETLVELTRKNYPSNSYDIRMISALGESATVHMTDAGKLTSFYPYQVIFIKSGNEWKTYESKQVGPTVKTPVESGKAQGTAGHP